MKTKFGFIGYYARLSTPYSCPEWSGQNLYFGLDARYDPVQEYLLNFLDENDIRWRSGNGCFETKAELLEAYADAKVLTSTFEILKAFVVLQKYSVVHTGGAKLSSNLLAVPCVFEILDIVNDEGCIGVDVLDLNGTTALHRRNFAEPYTNSYGLLPTLHQAEELIKIQGGLSTSKKAKYPVEISHQGYEYTTTEWILHAFLVHKVT